MDISFFVMSQGELPLSPPEAACFFLSLSSESEGVSQYTFEQGASSESLQTAVNRELNGLFSPRPMEIWG